MRKPANIRTVMSARVSPEVRQYLMDTGQGLTGVCERLILRSAEFKKWKREQGTLK